MFYYICVFVLSAGAALHFQAREIQYFIYAFLSCAFVLGALSIISFVSANLRAMLKRMGCLAAFTALALWLHQNNVERIIDRQLSPDLEGQTLEVVGRITNLPERDGEYLRFELDTEVLTQKHSEAPVAGIIRLSWKTEQSLRSGEHWRFSVRLKRPRGFANPKGFDYQAWLLAKGVVATGYVYKNNATHLAGAKADVSAIRQKVSESLNSLLFNAPQAPILKALLIGDRSGISASAWERFRNTGTIHLMAISGLHVGLIAGFVALVSKLLLRPLVLFVPLWFVRSLVALTSVAAAIFYAVMAGFSVPTQRAVACVAIVHILLLFERRSALLPLLGVLACIALYKNPFVLMQSGYVLSFSAVAVLLIAFSNCKRSRSFAPRNVFLPLYDFAYAQWVLLIGLLPLMTALNLPSAAIAPLANAIAVPAVSFAVLPLAFLGLLISKLSDSTATALFYLSGYLLSVLDHFLQQVEQLRFFIPFQKNLSYFDLILMLIAVLFFLSPRALRLRMLGLLVLFPIFLNNFSLKQRLENEVVILDAGQGLASILKGENGTLVYDIGARFSDSFSIARHVVSPYFDTHVYRPVTHVVLSHADNDHAGDALAFVGKLRAQQTGTISVVSGEAKKLQGINAQACEAGTFIDGGKLSPKIDIQVLWPDPYFYSYRNSNNRSCVLLLNIDGKRILFSGDIEKAVEQELLERGVLPRDIDLLVAPHHGSATSSTPVFLEHLRPKHVVFSAGYRNRYRHPADRVVARYTKIGSTLWNTAVHGALSISVENDVLLVQSERCRNWRKWYLQDGNCESGSSQRFQLRYD